MTTTVEPKAGSTLTARRLSRLAPIEAAVAAVLLSVVLAATTPVSGTAGTAVVAVLLFLVIYTVWSNAVEGRRHAADRLASTLVYACFVLAVVPLVAILGTVVVEGAKALSLDFLTHSMRNVSPREAGGGVYHAIIGTIEQVGLAALIGIPVGILVAVYLVEYGRRGWFGRAISFFVDVMTGVPSIVAGLFIFSFWVLTLGFDRSGVAASLSLVILMIPVVVRGSEEMLRLVPNELRESSYALGVPKYRTILRIVLPTAMAGLVTACLLSIARVAGETAPLLLTAFLSQSINTNPFTGAQASLPTFIYAQIGSGTTAGLARAWAGALTLVLLITILNLTARLVARTVRVK